MRSTVAGENSYPAKLRNPRARGSKLCVALRMWSQVRRIDKIPTSPPCNQRPEAPARGALRRAWSVCSRVTAARAPAYPDLSPICFMKHMGDVSVDRFPEQGRQVSSPILHRAIYHVLNVRLPISVFCFATVKVSGSPGGVQCVGPAADIPSASFRLSVATSLERPRWQSIAPPVAQIAYDLPPAPETIVMSSWPARLGSADRPARPRDRQCTNIKSGPVAGGRSEVHE